jgi:hypothetical protein
MIPTLLLGCAATLASGALGVYRVELHRLTALGYVLICLSPFLLFCTTPMFARSTAARVLFVIAPLPYFIVLLMWSWDLQPVGQHVLVERDVAGEMAVGQKYPGDNATVEGCHSNIQSSNPPCCGPAGPGRHARGRSGSRASPFGSSGSPSHGWPLRERRRLPSVASYRRSCSVSSARNCRGVATVAAAVFQPRSPASPVTRWLACAERTSVPR